LERRNENVGLGAKRREESTHLYPSFGSCVMPSRPKTNKKKDRVSSSEEPKDEGTEEGRRSRAHSAVWPFSLVAFTSAPAANRATTLDS